MKKSPEEIKNLEKLSYELPNRVKDSVPNPKITVRTSTYNHAPFIEKCIEGVLMQQTDFEFEYIIGEDFSTDGTREIVFDYAARYPNIIRVITADRNVGMKANSYRCRLETRGEYSAICEGDDYWTDPKKLQKQIDLLSEYPECDLCFHPAIIHYVDYPGKEKITGKQADGNVVIPVEKLILNYGDFCPTASVIYNSRIHAYLNDWFLETLVGDYYFQIVAADRGGALYLDEVMSVYNKSKKGAWSRISKGFKQRTIKEKSRSVLNTCNTMEELDKIMDYRHHKWIRKLRLKRLLNFFLKFYSFEKSEREDIKEVIFELQDPKIKVQVNGILILSFIYHKLGFKEIKSLFNRIRRLYLI